MIFWVAAALAAPPAPGELLAHYEPIRAAMAADRLADAQAGAQALAAWTDEPALDAAAGQLAAAADLPAARMAFGALSLAATPIFAAAPPEGLKVFHCPMWDGFAYWYQPMAGISNPYMGPDMPTCGEGTSLKVAVKAASK